MTSPRQLDVAWLRALSRSVPFGIIAIDDHQRVRFASDRAIEFLGLTPEAGLDAVATRLCEAAAVRQLADFDVHGRTFPFAAGNATEPCTIRVRAERLDDTSRARLLLLTDSCTIEELRSTLHVVSRDPGLSNFDASVVHDLKAPLNVLALHVELIKRRFASHESGIVERVTSSLDVMKREIQRLDHMLLEALDLSVEHDASLERRFDVAHFIPSFGDLVRPLCQHQNVEFLIDVIRAPMTVYGDATRFKQALLNLVMNALDAMKGAGRLELAADLHDGLVRIRVSDTGPGFPPETIDNMWTLQRTNDGKGHGIGLAVVRTVIQGLGGRVAAENRASGGCMFTIELPLAP